MTNVTFLHTSDWQLGMGRWFLDGEAQARFDDARLTAIQRMGEIAVERDCEFIVVAGDVFDANSLSPQTVGRALETLRALKVPVYLLPGNHDPLTADSIFNTLDVADNVRVLRDSTPISIRDGVELVGAPLLSKRASIDLVGSVLAGLSPSDGIRILVGHGQVAARGELRPDLIDLDAVEAALSDGRISYLALGDTHSTEAIGSSGAVWFSGAPEVTAFHDHTTVGGGETDSGNALVVSISETGVSTEKVRVGQWAFEAIDAQLESQQDVEEFLDRLDAYPDKHCVAIKYELTGTLELSAMQFLEEGLAQREPIFASLKPRDSRWSLILSPTESDLENLDISGYAKDALAELSSTESPAAASAVRLLFRLAKGAQ